MLEEHFDVLIIGAGAAGLAAARELSAAGCKTVILEARDRIGGRIFTHWDDFSPVPIELGAEFIHGRAPELFQITSAANLPLCDSTDRHWFLRDGALVKSAEFWTKLEHLMDDMKRLGQPDRSFQDYLASLPNDPETRETKAIASVFVQGFHAARTEQISVQALVKLNEAADRIDGDKQFRILNGYSDVAEWLYRQAERQGAVIHLNTMVKELRWRSSQVNALCQHGSEVREVSASRGVVTLPLGVLQGSVGESGVVRFVPELPKEKQDAARSLVMGQVLKVTLRFRERFWEELELPSESEPEKLWGLGFIHSAELEFPTWWTLLPVRVPVIVGWVGGPRAEKLVERDEQFICDLAIENLATVLSVSKDTVQHQLQRSYYHNWHSDPFTRGAYSYIPVDGLEPQMTLSRAVQDTLFFAGEATSIEGHVGTVHGAISSGERVAGEILSRR